MKAAVLVAPNQPLAIEQLQISKPGPQAPTSAPSTATEARLTRCRTALTVHAPKAGWHRPG